jgi:hypothetical protein
MVTSHNDRTGISQERESLCQAGVSLWFQKAEAATLCE